MRILYFLLVLVAFTPMLTGCGAGAYIDGGGMASIDALETSLVEADSTRPTVAQYRSARAEFIASMKNTMSSQEEKLGSPVGKIKNVIATIGVLVGLGGTIASVVIDDEGDQATIAQSSAAVAGISGAIGLLPIGNAPRGAQAILTYIRLELPLFEERWPASPGERLTGRQWNEFLRDTRQMQRVVTELSR